MEKRNTVKSAYVRFGSRTFFFDVNQSKNQKKYLRITESKYMGEGEKRIYNSLMLFTPGDVSEFQKTLQEVAGFLSA